MDLKTLDDEIMLSDGRVIKIPVNKIEEINKDEKKKVQIEKVPNVWGSSAGAGSDYFDLYRKQRNQENERLELIEKKWKEYTENQIFQQKRNEKIEYMEKKRLKKGNKRLIKKQKIKELRNQKKKNKLENINTLTTQNDNNKESSTDKFKHTESDKDSITNSIHAKEGKGKGNQSFQNERTEECNTSEDKNNLNTQLINTNKFLILKEDELF
ncbi:conserved protein, unknown function [Plasmodium berghei]|uniref:Uncharacterized protein n=2 Tax=Plasmodium berghei TaxID=5821 RepID=A0A509AMX9_PLABA|nr:conserved protein, unknown function [Plasmodium berghei ANKA]CXI26552.1 conserved protein, unknown function [Plasmodium berghei]SCM20511.1 conserved protein, unknown function [Plasmodium berghei]SCN24087.1 conserved protein, unknown function [Plasmodium berghei]SCO59390.1 conserved protein, unknown function [Plasmodium berghei]SCO60571.1 conserved protein, unknown function [Plasmodium berghei]|eukprot:XP_034420927.1 conserved protein, unknown function [Plasmodium berghei ANKA]